MRTRRMFAASAAALLAMTVVGCSSSQQEEPSSQHEPATAQNEPAPSPAAEPAPKPKPRRTTGFPSMRGGGYNWSWLAYPTGDPSSSALGIEKGVPSEVRLNQPFDYQIVVTNLTDIALQDVVVQETLGANMRFNSSTPETSSRNSMLTWALGEMGPREVRTIVVNATATAQGTVGSCATATYNSELCAQIPVVQPELRITKAGPAEVLACDTIQYVFEVTNTGTGSIDNVVVNDSLPNGLQTANGTTDVRFNVGSLAAGESKKYSMNVEASGAGRYVNTATASGAGGVSASSNEVVTVVRKPVLEIAKTGPSTRFLSGSASPATYEITVRNSGDGVARNTVVRDQLPAGASFVRASDGGVANGGSVSWNVGELAPGASRTMTLTMSATQPGEFCNTATASAYCAEPVTARACTEFKGIPAILLEVVDSPDPIQVGETTTYTITATNQGFALDTNVRIICTIPGNQEYVSSAGATTGTLRGNTLTFAPLPRLEAKQRATWTVTVRATGEESVRFGVSMASDQLQGEPVRETEATNQYR
ncbi:MAG: hypothetical protein ACIARR_08625 [Phycisphaerales bacterium JB059]